MVEEERREDLVENERRGRKEWEKRETLDKINGGKIKKRKEKRKKKEKKHI